MGLNIGNTTIGGIYLGNTKISEAYLGSTKIYSATAPQPTDEVQIGNQIWKNANLAIDDGQGGIYKQTVNYGQGNVVEYYYTWDAAVRVANSIPGWHLPSIDELNTLISNIGGSSNVANIKATYGWNVVGNNMYGFNALGTGYYNNGSFYDFKVRCYLWSTTKGSFSKTYRTIEITSSSGDVSHRKVTHGNSVRLVKD